MAVIAEAKTERLVYKLYTDATYNSTTEPVMATDPAATGGQYLRHVSHTLNLTRDQYRPNEKRVDAQRPMGTSGSKTFAGAINGFLSPGTQADLFKGVFRNPWTAAVTASEADFTSATFDSTASTVVFAGGNPVTKGYVVGGFMNFTNLATAANNSTNFLILAFGGTSNRTVTLFPAPTTETADTAFNVTSVGKILTNPSSGLTDYKFAFEWYNPAADFSRFGSECRMGGFDLAAPVNNNVTLNFNVMGRNRTVLSGASSPFFTAPTAETTTDIPTAMQGLLRLNGSTLGVCTTSSIKVNLNPQAAKVVNSAGLVGAVFLEDFMLDGDFTSFIDGSTLFDAYDNKTEMEFFCYYPTSNAIAAPAHVFYMPRIRLTGCVEGETAGGKTAACTFEAGRYSGATAGVASTTLQIADTNA